MHIYTDGPLDKMLSRRKLTRYKLGQIAGIGQQTLLELNKGLSVNGSTLAKIAAALQITPGVCLDELIEEGYILQSRATLPNRKRRIAPDVTKSA